METLAEKSEFFGFEPSLEIKSFAKEILGQVAGDAPSDSSARMELTKTLSGFTGILRISSLAGTFFAEAACKDPLQTIQNLQESVLHQIAKWRSRRWLAD